MKVRIVELEARIVEDIRMFIRLGGNILVNSTFLQYWYMYSTVNIDLLSKSSSLLLDQAMFYLHV